MRRRGKRTTNRKKKHTNCWTGRGAAAVLELVSITVKRVYRRKHRQRVRIAATLFLKLRSMAISTDHNHRSRSIKVLIRTRLLNFFRRKAEFHRFCNLRLARSHRTIQADWQVSQHRDLLRSQRTWASSSWMSRPLAIEWIWLKICPRSNSW